MVDTMNKKNLLFASIGVVIIAVILISAAVMLSSKPKSSVPSATSNSQVSTSILLTDPPVVPNGTTSLFLQYSSVSVHSPVSGGWVSSNTQGSVNLMALTNLSVVIGNLNLSSNAAPDLVRFYASNANITINGTTYNVTIPGGQITAHLSNNTKLNGTSSILVQLYPVVVTIYTNTTPDFILVPSAKAVMVGNVLAGKKPREGEFIPLTHNEDRSLDSATPNITITNASVMQANNTTALTFTLTDNSNYSIRLMHMGLSGPETISVNAAIATAEANTIIAKAQHILSETENDSGNTAISSEGNVSSNHTEANSYNASHDNRSGPVIHIGANVSTNVSSSITSANGTGTNVTYGTKAHTIIPAGNRRILPALGMDGNSRQQNYGFGGSYGYGNNISFGHLNEIGDLTGNSSINLFVNTAMANGTVNTTYFKNELASRIRNSLDLHYMENEMFQNRNRMLEFQIAGNGSLQLPFSEDQFLNDSGYVLKPGESHTFTFSGAISLANGKMQISLVPGANYSISVHGTMGAMATENVTAVT